MADLIITEKSNITAIADGIRQKLGTSSNLTLRQMAELASQGGSEVIIKNVTATPSSNSASISFSGLDGEPIFFSLVAKEDVTVTTTRYVAGVEFDGTNIKILTAYDGSTSSTRKIYYYSTGVTHSYSNGTMNFSSSTSTTGYFASGITYELSYIVADLGSITEQPAPVISVSNSGLITATAGSKSSTQQLETQSGGTIIPSTSSQVAAESGKYTTGTITVEGDTNLVAENIRQGVSIFGIAGTHAGSATDTTALQEIINNMNTVIGA